MPVKRHRKRITARRSEPLATIKTRPSDDEETSFVRNPGEGITLSQWTKAPDGLVMRSHVVVVHGDGCPSARRDVWVDYETVQREPVRAVTKVIRDAVVMMRVEHYVSHYRQA